MAENKSDVVRWQPKTNYAGDKPMYMTVKGSWVTYADFRKVWDENEKLKVELTKAYMKLNGVTEDDGERYAPAGR